jgi:hypothetical protein
MKPKHKYVDPWYKRVVQFITHFVAMLVLVLMLGLTMMNTASDNGDYGFHSDMCFCNTK